MLYALLALAVFGLITSSVFAGMALAAVPRYLRERRQAFARPRIAIPLHPSAHPPQAPPRRRAQPRSPSLPHFSSRTTPSYEILFCARSADDAGLAAARSVAARFPAIPAQFLSTGEPPYINAKAASMELMEQYAAHDILVISDSDVRVTPDYLRSVALPFSDARVGALTCPYRGVAAPNSENRTGLWARLEAVGMSVEMTAGVLVARSLEGMQFTLGPTMAFRRETIRRMGGFRVTADYCADDFILGNETFKLGQTRHPQPSRHRPHRHQLQLPAIHAAPGPLDEVHALLAPQGPLRHRAHFQHALRHPCARRRRSHASPCPRYRLSSLGSRHAPRPRYRRRQLGCRRHDWLNLLVLYPIRDFMGFFFWAASYTSSRIWWRGRRFQLLPGGKMRPV